MTATEDARQSTESGRPAPAEGINAFIVRVLEQLSLSAWLPAAFLSSSLALLERFWSNQRIDVGQAVRDITENPAGFLVLLVPLIVVATMVTQAFSFTAIRTLEGYWRGRGLAGIVRSLLIRRQLWKKTSATRRRKKATQKAFTIARPGILERQSPSIVNHLEATAFETELPPVSQDEQRKLEYLKWRNFCDPWHLAKVDSLLAEENRYPRAHRVMPTKLGNVLRKAEDDLEVLGEDVEGWVIRRKDLVPLRVQIDHDHFRTRLDMYAILVFIGAFMAIVTPLALAVRVDNEWSIAITTAVFAVVSLASYQAAISSAEGYAGILSEIKRRSGSTQLD